MKKIFYLLLTVVVVAMPAVLTSCGETNEPKEDKFENLYGYWINSDYSGAMEIVEGKNDSYCSVRYFVYTPKGLISQERVYNGNILGALTPDGEEIGVVVLSNSSNKLVLADHPGWESRLSSYVFSRVNESKFYEYLAGGDNNEQDDEAKKLIGTWVGYDGTPGRESTDKYTLTFYSSGKATEVCSYSGGSESMSGTYEYSNGKITEWEMEDGSILMNTLGECPWIVTFITSTEITIGDKDFNITFTKQ